jgi:hypothetical protein
MICGHPRKMNKVDQTNANANLNAGSQNLTQQNAPQQSSLTSPIQPMSIIHKNIKQETHCL